MIVKFSFRKATDIIVGHYEFRADRKMAEVASLKHRHDRIAGILDGRRDHLVGIMTAHEFIKEHGVVAAKRALYEQYEFNSLWDGFMELVAQRIGT